MTSRRAVNDLVQGQKALQRRAVNEFRRFWNRLDKTGYVDDALIEVFAAITDRYGEVGAVAAAEWFEAQRGLSGFTATVSSGKDISVIARDVKFAVRNGYTTESLNMLEGMLGRHVLQAARNTISDNTGRDPLRPRFARVPVGKTCAWCIMLGSRGFVYWSAESAGEFEKYHDDCDCAIVPSWDADPKLAGYDIADLKEKYSEARKQADSSSETDILAAMRRLYPNNFTDGVF